ncbi:MAG: hypothetical protein IJT41_06155 [Clostridia bacterium]|nr:hypothetical protein [Clostridia bacterium]
MRKNRWVCALLCAALALAFSACGKADTPVTTTAAETESTAETTAAVPTDAESEPAATAAEEETEAVSAAESTEAGETETETTAVSLETGLESTDVAQVLAFYKLAAAKNDVKQYTKTLDLISLDGGEGKVGSYVSVFEPIAKKAIAKNSTTGEPLPGKYQTIRPEDWQSATATTDGKTTTIRVQVAPQTDGANGREFDGPVGRSMTVLNGVQMAVDEMPGVSADFANGQVSVAYLNPTITVRIDNSTGKFVPGTCKWTYRVHPLLSSLDAKVLAFNVHLQNAEGYIDYTMSY